MSFWLSKKLLVALESKIAWAPEGLVGSVATPKLCKALLKRGLKMEEISAGGAESTASSSSRYGVILYCGLAQEKDWHDRLLGMKLSLVHSGQIISVDKGTAHEVSRRLLCSGFTNVSQTTISGRIISTGERP